MPTTIIAAPKLDEETTSVNKNVSIDIRKALLRNTIIFNSIGFPAISIPIGFTTNFSLPTGMQIIGPPNGEDLVLSIAYQIECMNKKIVRSIPPIV